VSRLRIDRLRIDRLRIALPGIPNFKMNHGPARTGTRTARTFGLITRIFSVFSQAEEKPGKAKAVKEKIRGVRQRPVRLRRKGHASR
jgi:hypothetical protein